ncbi:MAG: cation:proton antiporter [Marmoricola sp.]
MGFTELSVICAIGLLGPLLALPRGWHLPVVLGELIAGAALGRTGLGYLHASDPTFTFLGDVGFALVMFVAGTHVPVRDPKIRPALLQGAIRAVAVGVIAGGLGYALAAIVGIGHGPLYAVLTASSSAAIILPIVDSLGLGGEGILGLLPQVAIADAACIVALPLAIDPPHAARAALGALAVIAVAAVAFLVLRRGEQSGTRERIHQVSEERSFALELRIQLAILFGIAALAVQTHVSIMLAGFAFGLVVAAVGEPRRLAKQLFALTEGFLGPVYFIWLGAELNLRELVSHPAMIGLAFGLAIAAAIAHTLMRLLGQGIPYGMLAAAQLGVPVSAATIGAQLHLLKPGEGSALMLGAMLTIAIAVAGGSRLASGSTRPPKAVATPG